MKSKIIILFAIVFLIAGAVYLVYTKTDQPISEQEKIGLSISTQFNNKKVPTTIVLETNQGIIELNTSENYELIKVLPNQTVKIANKNIDDQKFYSDSTDVIIGLENKRVDLILDEPKELSVEVTEPDSVEIYLFSENFKDVKFCLTWSLNFIFVKALNFTEIDRLDGYEEYERCYNGEFSLYNSNKTIQVLYQTMGIQSEKDYIDMIILDKAGNGKIVNIK